MSRAGVQLFSLDGVRTVTHYIPIVYPLPCQYVVKTVLGLSSVKTLKRVWYVTSGCGVVRIEEGKFVVCCVKKQPFSVVVQCIPSVCTQYLTVGPPDPSHSGTIIRVHQDKKVVPMC